MKGPVEQRDNLMNYPFDNEINLADIISFLYKSRRIIISITLFFTLVASFIAYRSPPQYKISVQLTPPKLFQYSTILTNTDLKIDSKALFKQFTDQLKSTVNLISFLLQSDTFKTTDKKNLAENEKILLANQLASSYKIIEKETNHLTGNEVNLELISSSIDTKAKDILAYINYTNNLVIKNIEKEQNMQVKLNIAQLEQQMQLAEKKEKINRAYRIERLKNDRKVAIEKLHNNMRQLQQKDIHQKNLLLAQLTEAYELAKINESQKNKSTPLLRLADNSNSTGKLEQLIDIHLNQPDMYLRGTQYLQKAIELEKSLPHTTSYEQEMINLRHNLNLIETDPEISLIEQRKNDSIYTANIESDLTKLYHLRHLTFDTTGAQTYNLNDNGTVNITPIARQKKPLIIFAGTILGFMFALFVAWMLTYGTQLMLRIKKEAG